MSRILRDILDSTKLDPDFCADLVGVPKEQFREWLTGDRPIPRFALPELGAILGVDPKMLTSPPDISRRSSSGTLAPAIWYKLRDDKLLDCDRELVGLIRKLGYYIGQLQEIRNVRARQFEGIFEAIRDKVDRSQPPLIQGRAAAKLFRSMTDLAQGQVGIGEWVRPTIRRLGVLVVESPMRSAVEGFAFTVGSDDAQTPCLFANSYRSTWFRRNAILLHELAHSIFDLENDQVTIDYRDADAVELSELIAQEFAQQTLVPKSVLNQIQNRRGFRWDDLSQRDVAALVADSHAEQKLVLKAAVDNELITEEQSARYLEYDCAGLIRELSQHAQSTKEYLRNLAVESPKWIAENRNTDIGRRPLRLPAAYVGEVIEAFKENDISLGKAAEMLLMDRDTFSARFIEQVHHTV